MAQEQRCPRCGTAVPAGKIVCQHCEQPIHGGRTGVRYNPAGLAIPSPIQGHATIMLTVIGVVLLLAVIAVRALGGVGPFTAEVTGTEVRPDRSGMTVQLVVTNNGDRAGRAKCRVIGRDRDGALHNSSVMLTDAIQPKRTGQIQLPLDGVRGGELDVTCG